MAQIFLESGELALLEEQGISDEKEKSSYRGYKGRGLIQITFPEPYMEYGKYKGLDFTNENRKNSNPNVRNGFSGLVLDSIQGV